MESNIKIKATVPEMNEFFEKDGGVRFYEIKDSRYTQADLESMPEDRYYSERFTFAVLYRHMELEKHLSGTFTIPGLTQKLEKLREAQHLLHTPVYRHTAEYAVEHDELSLYRESLKDNIACKEAFEDAINEHYRENSLDIQAVCDQVGHKFGMERMVYVLANTIQEKDGDGRISRENKAWAKSVPVAENTDAWGQNRNCWFVVDQINPGLVDMLVTHVRKKLAKEKDAPEKKPSVLGRLQKQASTEHMEPTNAPAKKSKGQEL